MLKMLVNCAAYSANIDNVLPFYYTDFCIEILIKKNKEMIRVENRTLFNYKLYYA